MVEARRGPGLEAGRVAALATRSAKSGIEDREVLSELWDESARSIGLDLAPLVERAHQRVQNAERQPAGMGGLIERGRKLLRQFAAHMRGNASDPLVPSGIHKQDRQTIAAAQAVASAVRHLSRAKQGFFEREALFKAALDFGLPTTIAHVGSAAARGR